MTNRVLTIIVFILLALGWLFCVGCGTIHLGKLGGDW